MRHACNHCLVLLGNQCKLSGFAVWPSGACPLLEISLLASRLCRMPGSLRYERCVKSGMPSCSCGLDGAKESTSTLSTVFPLPDSWIVKGPASVSNAGAFNTSAGIHVCWSWRYQTLAPLVRLSLCPLAATRAAAAALISGAMGFARHCLQVQAGVDPVCSCLSLGLQGKECQASTQLYADHSTIFWLLSMLKCCSPLQAFPSTSTVAQEQL